MRKLCFCRCFTTVLVLFSVAVTVSTHLCVVCRFSSPSSNLSSFLLFIFMIILTFRSPRVDLRKEGQLLAVYHFCCPITCFKVMSIVISLPYQGLIRGWPPHKPKTLCCICKACFKRRATALLSWLDCSSTAARH